jgi:hypothetical protein
MDKLFHKLLDLYLKEYLRKNRGQISAIEKLTVRAQTFGRFPQLSAIPFYPFPAMKSLKNPFRILGHGQSTKGCSL